MSTIDGLLKTLSKAPDHQIDKSISTQITRLIGCDNEIVVLELTELLDECIKKSLATDFSIKILKQAIETASIKN